MLSKWALLCTNICISCKEENPSDLQKKLVGEWIITTSTSKEPNLLIYPVSDNGLFAYDDLIGKWRSYSAWLSASNDTLFGWQGCLNHYRFKLTYLPSRDELVVDDTLILKHSKLMPRRPVD